MASNKEVKNTENINVFLDETKSTVKKSTDEAVKEIPRFTKAVNEYQQETIQATKDIADNFLESQKEVIHSMQSLWVPYIENVQNSYLSYWVSPQRVTENYARAVSNVTDSTDSRNQTSKQLHICIYGCMEKFNTARKRQRKRIFTAEC